MIPLELKSILLVDDDESTNFINKIFINKLNLDIQVNTALNGKQALDFLENDKSYGENVSFITPCLLILDINMPIMNGWEFLEAYEERVSKEIKDKIVIVMITISNDEKHAIEAKNNPNINEYIQKPLSDVKFESLINKYFLEKQL